MIERLLLCCVLAGLVPAAQGDVTHADTHSFTLRFEMRFDQPAAEVYATLLDIEAWWDPAHTYSGDVSNLQLEVKPGGCLCEYWDGGAVEHLRVAYVQQNSTLRLLGGLGPLQSIPVEGSMTFTVVDDDQGSRFLFTYLVGGFTENGIEDWAEPVDGVWAGHLARFKTAVESDG